MKITELLSVEHTLVLAQLDHVKGLIDQGASAEEIAAAVRAVAVAVDVHQANEHRFFMPLVREAFGPELPLLRRIEAEEHEVTELLSLVDGGGVLVGRFIDLLRRHIEEETRVLFPMVEDRVSAVKLESAAERCLRASADAGRLPVAS